MSDPRFPALPTPSAQLPDDRLESWKEIASYLRRDVTTVQRWERREGMPVHRHVHDKAGSVFAFRSELEAWAQRRTAAPAAAGGSGETVDGPAADRDAPVRDVAVPDVAVPDAAVRVPRWQLRVWGPVAIAIVLAVAFLAWQARRGERPGNPLADARFLPLTDFGGNEQAALSRDGKLAAFLSTRDGRPDVWVTQVGTGQFYKVARSPDVEIVNPSVRTLGFTPDGTTVTFWTRKRGTADGPDISIWSAPVLGGQARPYLEGVAEFDWSADGARLAYHTPGPGDPLFVREPGQEPRQIFSAPAGQHAHFPVWSPDQAFIYFVQGALPDRLDLWRIRPAGGAPERITHHESRVSHPAFLDERTLLYLATEPDGAGPGLYRLDVGGHEPQRVSFGLERYTSLAASADGRRLVATVAGPGSTFWRIPVSSTPVDASAARRISLTTGGGTFPRLGAGDLFYVSSRGDSDSIWKLRGETAVEVWSAPDARIIDGPAIARDGRRIAFSARRQGDTSLHVVNADGTNARIVTRALALHGAPAWAPDGQSVTVAAIVNGSPRLFGVPLEGGSPAPIMDAHASAPVWMPDGDVLVYSGPDVGTIFQVKAVPPHAGAAALRDVTLSRGSKYRAASSGSRSLFVLRGDLGHRNLWLIDLATGAERQLTAFAADFHVVDFDVSPDGHELVLHQSQEHSDIVLIELAPR